MSIKPRERGGDSNQTNLREGKGAGTRTGEGKRDVERKSVVAGEEGGLGALGRSPAATLFPPSKCFQKKKTQSELRWKIGVGGEICAATL